MFGLSSQSSNEIFPLEIPGRSGVIGLCACPGIRLEAFRRGNTARYLKSDLAGIHEWGAAGVVTLNEVDELENLGLGDLGLRITETGLWWRHLPIMDMNVPRPGFEESWQIESKRICSALLDGERIVIHCLAGLGRTGMIAARLLVDMGMSPERAIVEVRRVRSRAIQTQEQAEYVHQFGKKTANDRWSRLQGRQIKHTDSNSGSEMKGFGT